MIKAPIELYFYKKQIIENQHFKIFYNQKEAL